MIAGVGWMGEVAAKGGEKGGWGEEGVGTGAVKRSKSIGSEGGGGGEVEGAGETVEGCRGRGQTSVGISQAKRGLSS